MPILTIYCGILCFAAVPRQLVPKPLSGANETARSLLWNAFRFKAGEEVFAGDAPDVKQKLICLTVFGLNAREPRVQAIGFQSFPNCEPPRFRLHSSPFALALNGSVWLLLAPSGDMERLLAEGPRDERLRAISRYFCSSPRSAIRGSDEVVMAVEYHSEHYYTGQITKRVGVIHEHVCAQDVSISRENLRLRAEKLSSGRISLRSAEP